MVISTPRPVHADDTSLAAAIGNAGRRATPRSLLLILAGGCVAGSLVATLWRGHRMMAVPFVMPITFAMWGLAIHAERTLEPEGQETLVERILLRVLRGAMVVIGALAAAVTIFAVTFGLAGSGGLQFR